MCGIVGGWFPAGDPTLAERLSAGVETLRHRGPDDCTTLLRQVFGGCVAFGHTRLSVIDLSSGGNQPRQSRDGRYELIYNGEIYNYVELRNELRGLGHVFDADSDTEVLLAAFAQWGAASLERLDGMFAFVVHDTVENTLTCARDAFGIKPLFYALREGNFTFASEVPALLRLQLAAPSLDLQRVYDYLTYGHYDDEERTFFSGVRHLMPAHVMVYDLAASRVRSCRRWWWPSIKERTDLSFAGASERLREMFLSNVRRQLRSDVPLGAALSGGIDSSAVVCAMRHVEPEMPIQTFTYAARGSGVDEEPWADLVNQHVGADAHKVVVSPDELARDLDDMIMAQGEPFGSTSIYAQYRVFKLARERGVTVTLDGQGADELLGGYHGYPGPRLHSMLAGRRFGDAARFLQEWARWPERSMMYGLLSLGEQLVPDGLRDHALRVVGRNPEPGWLDTDCLKEQGVRCRSLPRVTSKYDKERRLVSALRSSLGGLGLPSLLRHGDRNSMRWSVESRVPFLTKELAAYSLSLPEHFLVSREGESKHVFREAMRGIVPDAVLNRRDKIGFTTPELAWLRLLGPQVDEWLDAADSISFLRADAVRRDVSQTLAGIRAFNGRTWRLINFCRWTQLMGVYA